MATHGPGEERLDEGPGDEGYSLVSRGVSYHASRELVRRFAAPASLVTSIEARSARRAHATRITRPHGARNVTPHHQVPRREHGTLVNSTSARRGLHELNRVIPGWRVLRHRAPRAARSSSASRTGRGS